MCGVKKMKKIIVGLIIVFALIISGCNSSSSIDGNIDTNYHSGTKGIELNFIANAPPSKIYNTESLEIMVEVTNRGATDVPTGKLYISGYDPKYLQISPTSTSFNIKGKSIYNPDGRLNKLVTFTDSRVDIPENTDSLTQNIKVTACYNYKTEASESVCIDPNPRSITEKVCTPRSLSLSSGQGAPVTITSIDEEMGKDRVTFKINFANTGGGTIFDVHKGLTNCHTSLEYRDLDVVDVQAQLSDKSLSCEPNRGQGVKLVNGKGFVYCYYQGSLGDDAYSTQLSVDIEYAYRKSITKSFEIENI